MNVKGLDALFRPRTVAVVGASHDPAKLGHTLLRNVLEGGFAGEVHPVNPAGGEILGHAVHRSIRELPVAPDLVLLSIPSRLVPAAIRESARRGARAAVILSSGFGEMGGEGARLQREVRGAGLRVLGPNCMGVFHLPGRLNATYFWDVPRRKGGLAFVSQSGAYGGLLLSEMRRRSIGISSFVSLGNQADITHADVMEQLALEPDVRVAALFIEEIRDADRFIEACRRLAKTRRVVAMKVGRTASGRRAALSHTGSMAGDHDVCLAALRQAGCLVARGTDEFFDILALLDAYPGGLPAGRGVGIVTISGGPCVAAADACEEAGVPVPELSSATQARVKALIPEFGAATNPVDMTPQMDPMKMGACVEAVARDRGVGALLAINVGLDRPQFAEAFVRVRRRKPVIAFVVDVPQIAGRFAEDGIPIFGSPERAARALAAIRGDRPGRDAGARGAHAAHAGRADGGAHTNGIALDEWRSKERLRKAGLPVCRQERASSLKGAARAAARLGYPVALKSLGAGTHKWTRGGMMLNLDGESALSAAYRRLERRFGARVLVQEMARGEHELLVGARRDPTFGPVMIFGTGGVWTERARDISIRVGRLDRRGALEMIGETQAGRALSVKDRAALARILVSLSRWMKKAADVLEVDINPVIAGGARPVAVDALVVRRRS